MKFWGTLGCWLLCVAPLSAANDPPQSPPPDEQVEAQAEEIEAPEVAPEIFDDALEDFFDRRYGSAAAGFYGYIHLGKPSAENYEWAQFFLGRCLDELGFTYAAAHYYYIVAKTRSRPEILPEALRRLRSMARDQEIDEALIYGDLLYGAEFGNLPLDLSHWVHLIQGLYDYRRGFSDWGKRHLSKIGTQSILWGRGLYIQGVHALRMGKDKAAHQLFAAILDAPQVPKGVRNQAYLALGRLLFDQGRYADALVYYDQVIQDDLSFEQAQLLIEKAWTHYHLGHLRKAMGLLQALQAPSYAPWFLPDVYVLRGLIYKDLCHYIPAKRVVRAFRRAYVRSLDFLRRRVPLQDNERVFNGATQEGMIASRTDFLHDLEEERALIGDWDSDWEEIELDRHLRRLYDLQIRNQGRLWRHEFKTAADRVALELLEVEEQMNLLDYEIGLDIFRRIKLTPSLVAPEEKLVVPYDSERVYYEFEGEYWNDELHTYEFFVSSRCLDGGAQ